MSLARRLVCVSPTCTVVPLVVDDGYHRPRSWIAVMPGAREQGIRICFQVLQDSGTFIRSFCDPESSATAPNYGELGAYTPCFINIALLGASHLIAIAFYTRWLFYIRSRTPDHFRFSRLRQHIVQWSAITACMPCVAYPLYQLKERLDQEAAPLAPTGHIAPHELTGLLLAAASYLLLALLLLLEAGSSYVVSSRWLLRGPLTLVAASELVKARLVLDLVLRPDDESHALGPRSGVALYLAYVLLQLYVAALLLLWRLAPGDLKLVQAGTGVALPQHLLEQTAAAAQEVCPEYTAGVWAKATFSWLSPLLSKGYQVPLVFSDLWKLPPPDRVSCLHQRFRTAWQQQLKRRGPEHASLLAACWATVGSLFIAALPFKLVNDAAQFVGPVVLNLLLKSIASNSGGVPSDSDLVQPMRQLLSNSTVTDGHLDQQPILAAHALWGTLRGLALSLTPAGQYQGYLYALMLFGGTLLGVLGDNQHFIRVMRAGFRIKSVMAAEVHRKVLVLSPLEKPRFASGRIFNLVSADAQTLQDLCTSVFGFLSAPLRIFITMFLLYRQLGASCLVAVVCIMAAIPVNGALVRASAARLRAALTWSDSRTKMETEMVTGIEVVKASTWEQPFTARINAARMKELAGLKGMLMLQALVSFLVNSIPSLVPVASFLVFLLVLRTPLTPQQAFTSLALFNVLRFPLFQLPQIITQATQARVALGRLRELLAAEELPEQQQQHPELITDEGQVAAVRLSGDFTWDLDTAPSLTDIHLQIPKGQLVAVVGPTGCGKSSLLSAILGLMPGVQDTDTFDSEQTKPHQPVGTKGTPKSDLQQPLLETVAEDGPAAKHHPMQVVVNGSTAYVPQSAFLMNMTVRDNIMFGRPFEPQRYARCTAAANLDTDFAQFPAGDLTELGDRGITVSGGQKQRISIARALYADADVVLLDDPLSALDARVAKAVAHQGIKGVLRGKTVVLATNQLQFAAMADQVLFMRAGAIRERGSFQQLVSAGGEFASFMKEAQVEDDAEASSNEGNSSSSNGKTPEDAASPATADSAPEGGKGGSGGAAGPATADGTQRSAFATPAAQAGPPAPGAGLAAGGATKGRLIEEEGAATGGVSAAVVAAYIKALGGPLALLVLATTFVGQEALRVAATVWLSVWTGGEDTSMHGSLYYMGIYAAISMAQVALILVNGVQVAFLGIRAGRVLHEKLLQALLHAPLSFYHTTPTGRIVNRLTKDTADIDRNLAGNLGFAFRALLQLVSTLLLIAAGAPFALPALLVVLGVFSALYQFFMASMRQAKRLEAVSRSPVFNSVNEAIAGIATIRAFGVQPWLTQRHAQLVDDNAVTSLLTASLNRWLSVRLESLGALCTLLAAVVTLEQQGSSAAATGLLLTYALQITMVISITLRVGSLAEQSFNAVERVDEYNRLPAEESVRLPAAQGRRATGGSSGGAAGWGGGAGRQSLLPTFARGGAGGDGAVSVPANWPDKGGIQFRDAQLRYRPGLPLVLCGVTFEVSPGWKVGVVGRTGAGKSSLIGALFRLTELSGGSIFIDGLNTARVPLKRLRSCLSLIPQVPVLFTGSIRENLSPFGLHSDAALWAALQRSHLAPVVHAWEEQGLGGLDFQLGEGGSPLSAGQKQLLALARALLDPAKILVLDEATANVDVETDALIQSTLRTEFEGRTLVAVAHRLHTVIEADRVLVMEAGQVAEYGAPAQLLEDANGSFTGMVRETGEATERFLRSMAAGDPSAARELAQAAAAGLAAITACQQQRGACLTSMTTQLAERAQQLNRQLLGVMQVLKDAPGGLVLSDATSGGAGEGKGAGGASGDAAAAAGGAGEGGQAEDAGAARQRLSAALTAMEALQQMASELQAAVMAAGGSAAAGGSLTGSDEEEDPLQIMEQALSGTLGASQRQSVDLGVVARRSGSFRRWSRQESRRESIDTSHAGAHVASMPVPHTASMPSPDRRAASSVGAGAGAAASSSRACSLLAQCEKEQACKKQQESKESGR